VTSLLHKFVSHAAVEEHLAGGWLMTAALCGTHHGVHAMHMVWLCQCRPMEPQAGADATTIRRVVIEGSAP
jgi:hypothetical protein